MKNKEFFYLQYNKINWENQEKTKINYPINKFIIDEVLTKHKGSSIKIFDMGFGIGFFINMAYLKLKNKFKEIILEGCEPSEKNYNYFINKNKINFKSYNIPFQNVQTKTKFDFITSIYVFPHFNSNDLEKVVRKINLMLEKEGKFILVVANQKYLEEKLKNKKDLFIEENLIKLGDKRYKEVLHYSEIPNIGKVIDFNREDKFYEDLFEKYNFKLVQKKFLNENGFICNVFVFKKLN
jgi:2-polyprenyl-3-methyl-5-hydroxy-6-metoxy-1,4-benzoquinol methylase